MDLSSSFLLFFCTACAVMVVYGVVVSLVYVFSLVWEGDRALWLMGGELGVGVGIAGAGRGVASWDPGFSS